MSYTIRRPLSLDERNCIGGASDIIAHLLFHRGITDALSAERFLAPDYDGNVHDPFLLKDAERAAERILVGMASGERIAIYADYDADGIPGAVLWDDFFSRTGYANYSIYIPHRHNEGFGLNREAVEQLAREGVKLIVTVDCGISDIDPVDLANKLGVDIIITDHHEPPPILPDAYAVVDHKQDGCGYPDKNICGSGVAYKMVQAIIKKSKENRGIDEKGRGAQISWKEGHEKWLLDMVGIATLSDMVPLVGENRVFAKYGLAVLRKSPRKGLVRMLQKLKIAQPHLTEDDVAFMVTPRINAASRMGVPMDAFKLLAARTDDDAETFASHLDQINNERKGIVAVLVKEVKKEIGRRYGGEVGTGGHMARDGRSQGDKLPRVIVLGNPEWKPSLLGLVANTCAKEFRRPAFFWGRDGDGLIKGSCRSEGASDVVEIMRAVPEGVLGQFGGHKYSGGFMVNGDHIHYLEKYLNEAAEQIASQKEQTEISQDGSDERYVDLALSLDDVTWRLQEEIERLSPFGTGNPKPVFVFKGVRPDKVRVFGKSNDHIEIIFKRSSGVPIAAISFFGAGEDWARRLNPGEAIDLIASIEKSMFRGRKELRLRVEDVILFTS